MDKEPDRMVLNLDPHDEVGRSGGGQGAGGPAGGQMMTSS